MYGAVDNDVSGLYAGERAGRTLRSIEIGRISCSFEQSDGLAGIRDDSDLTQEIRHR